jgi:hypothetical protein
MESFEVIGAFIDRERVDPEALKHALSTEEGRQYLVDLVALREIAIEQAPPAPVAFDRRAPSRNRTLATAAAFALSVLAGYMAGQRSPSRPLDDRPLPSPVVIEVAQPEAAPAPTQVIQLRAGTTVDAAGRN